MWASCALWPQVARAGKVILARLQASRLALWALVGGKGSASPAVDTLATLEVSAAESAGGGGGWSAALQAHCQNRFCFSWGTCLGSSDLSPGIPLRAALVQGGGGVG